VVVGPGESLDRSSRVRIREADIARRLDVPVLEDGLELSVEIAPCYVGGAGTVGEGAKGRGEEAAPFRGVSDEFMQLEEPGVGWVLREEGR
jgi:hypothetical protein